MLKHASMESDWHAGMLAGFTPEVNLRESTLKIRLPNVKQKDHMLTKRIFEGK